MNAHAQRIMIHARIIIHDHKASLSYRARTPTQFIGDVKMGIYMATVQGAIIDNRWVIPYNPYLLRLFNCHINIDACSSIKVVKYLFKYIYKGHDCASVPMREASKA